MVTADKPVKQGRTIMPRMAKCPFCGGHRIGVHTVKHPDDEYTVIQCEHCRANTIFMGKEAVSEEEAIKRWNRRAIEL